MQVEKTVGKYAEKQIRLVGELFENVVIEAAKVGRERGWDAAKAVGYIAYNLVLVINQLTDLYIEFVKRVNDRTEVET